MGSGFCSPASPQYDSPFSGTLDSAEEARIEQLRRVIGLASTALQTLFSANNVFIKKLIDLMNGSGGVLGAGYVGIGLDVQSQIAKIVLDTIKSKSKDDALTNLMQAVRSRDATLGQILNKDYLFGVTIFGSQKWLSSDTRAYQDLVNAIEQTQRTNP